MKEFKPFKEGKDGRQKKLLPKGNSTGEKILVKRKGPCYNKNIWTLLPEHLRSGHAVQPVQGAVRGGCRRERIVLSE